MIGESTYLELQDALELNFSVHSNWEMDDEI